MSTALYRRYRPDTFDDVIGQEHVTKPLKAALDNGRVNHAYLFSGPRGCGKTTSARILARCLNCVEGPTSVPCGKCPSCQDLATGGPGSLDVVEIDAASHNGVDDARDLRERAVYAPARDRFKVFILDEAHMVTPQGFNALLKLVEEPPEHVKFIFATTEPEKVIGTIRSRTHHYPFRLVPPEILTNYLNQLCERENVPVGKGVLPLVVRAGGGSVRDTLSVLDQLMAGSTNDGIDYHTAVALLGYTPDSLLGDIVDAFCAGDGAAVFRVIDRVIESGQDPRRFVEDLLERFRDLIVVSASPSNAQAFLPEAPADLIDRLVSQAGQYGPAELSRGADLLNAGLSEMSGATSPRLQLELMCARILLPGTTTDRQAVLSRVERIERRVGMTASGAVPGQDVNQAGQSTGQAAGQSTGQAGQSTGQAGQSTGQAGQSTGQAGQQAPAAEVPPTQPPTAPATAGQNVPFSAPANQQVTEDDLDDDFADFAREAENFAQAEVSPRLPAARHVPEPTPAVEYAPREPVRDTAEAELLLAAQQPEPARAAQPPTASAPADAQPVPAQPQRSAEQSTPPGGEAIDAIRRSWPNILEAVGQKSKLLRAILAGNSIPQEFSAGQLTLGFNNQGSLNGFNRPGNDAVLSAAIMDVIGIGATIKLGPAGVNTSYITSHSELSGHQVSSHSNPLAHGQTHQATQSAQRPQASQHRPTRAEIDAVVGPRAVDQEPVDRSKYWTMPDENRQSREHSEADQEGENPQTRAEPQYGDPFSNDATVEPTVHERAEQPTRNCAGQLAQTAAGQGAQTAAGQGAVDMPQVVVPPATDDDDLNFLGIYADDDFGLDPEPDSPTPGDREPAPEQPRDTAVQTPGAPGSSAEDKTNDWGDPGDTGWGNDFNPDGPGNLGGITQTTRQQASNEQAAGQPTSTQTQAEDNFEDYDTENDPEVHEAPQVGVPVVQRILGGEIIEEFTE